jgi:hypothetical protein
VAVEEEVPLLLDPAITVSVPLVLAVLPPELGVVSDFGAAEFRCRSFGAGKLDFLSMASTVL